ncbi:MAG: hypothetical protein EXR72_10705 [Myxococcales bacterium]|nr:hypothetical protein [Myxococcales bacterium]
MATDTETFERVRAVAVAIGPRAIAETRGATWREVHREELVAPRDLADWDRLVDRARTMGSTAPARDPDVAVVLLDGRDEDHLPLAHRVASLGGVSIVGHRSTETNRAAARRRNLHLSEQLGACVIEPVGSASLADVVPALVDATTTCGLIGYSFDDLRRFVGTAPCAGELHVWTVGADLGERAPPPAEFVSAVAGVTGLRVHIGMHGGPEVTLSDINAIAVGVQAVLDEDAKVVFFAIVDELATVTTVRVTIVSEGEPTRVRATGRRGS